AKRTGEIDPANGGHNQIAEHEQHPGDADKTGDDEAERRIKKKVPPANSQPLLISPVPIEGDEQEIPAEDEMQNADDCKKSEAFPYLQRCDEQDISNQHLFDLLIAFGRAAQEQDCGSRRNNI